MDGVAGTGFARTPEAGAWRAIRSAKHQPLWLDDPTRPEPRPRLTGHVTVDVAVVGGGFTGLWAAVRLAEREPGLRVAVLEGDRLAEAASGRNGGFVAATLTHGYLNGLERWPEDFPTLHRMGLDNLDAVEDTIADYGIDCDYVRGGELDVATAPYQVPRLRQHAQTLREAGVAVDFLDTEAVRARVNSPTYLAGMADPHVAGVNPARLCWGLADVAEAGGVVVHEQTPVTSVRRRGARLVLVTPGGEVEAARVILAGGAHKPLLRRLDLYVAPVFDHVVATAPLPDDVREAFGWSQRWGVADTGNRFHYYRMTGDGRLVWGGYDAVYIPGGRPGSPAERDDFLSSRLVQHLHDTFPAVATVPVEYLWAGAIDTCSRFSAFWGRAFGGQVSYVTGYTGLGVAASRFGADVAIDLALGLDTERTALRMVHEKPLPFPPEPARRVVIGWTRAALAASDRHEGRRNLWLRTLDKLGLGFDS